MNTKNMGINEITKINIVWEIPPNIRETLDKITLSVQDDVEIVLTHQDFEPIIQYLKVNYSFYNDNEIPEELKKILGNEKFLSYINTHITNNLSNVLNNDSIYSFEEISFYMFLLWFWKYKGILQDLNTYDFQALSKLFDEYIERILESDFQSQEFYMYYNSFLSLSSVVNTLCILNQVDSIRKVLIPDLVSLVSSKTQYLIENLPNENQKISNDLHYIIARFWINFANIKYITTKKTSLETILSWFEIIVKTLFDSYQNALKTDFWNAPHKKENMTKVFLWNLSYSMMVMLTKISEHKKWTEKDLFQNKSFLSLLSYFKESFWLEQDKQLSIE